MRGWTTEDDAAAAAYAGDHYDDEPADYWPQHDLDRLSDERAAQAEEQRDRANDHAADHDARAMRARRDATRVPGTDPAEGRW